MKYLLVFIAFISSTSLYGQLQFVEADSVVMWDQGALNFRQVALSLGTTMQSFLEKKTLPCPSPQDFANWNERTLPDTAQTNVAYMASEQLYAAAQLLQHTADARYARSIEHLVYFPLQYCANQPGINAEKFVTAQALYNGMSLVVATQGNDLYVNYYPNSSIFIHTTDFQYQLDIVTLAPYDNRVKLRFSRVHPKTGAKFRVFLQMPEGEWNSQTMPIYCNGHDTPYTIHKGYAVVENTWKNAFEIYFDLPHSLYPTPND
ncbi:MAG: glycoside hydrolase family 127 protein [Bacteroidaceae bacterium]|nr:glycoside hydrolase family 127 protein [Bacteroidaceae bacterium]